MKAPFPTPVASSKQAFGNFGDVRIISARINGQAVPIAQVPFTNARSLRENINTADFVAEAINHHDALVDSLKDVISEFDRAGLCNPFALAKVQRAVELLTQIEGRNPFLIAEAA
jgi:hypothetical protein